MDWSFFRDFLLRALGLDRPLVCVVRLSGVISSGGRFGGGINLAGFADVLDRAFAPKRLSAVALVINSPGGSPAQSNLLTRRIRALAAEKNVMVIAFVEDVAASGGYMLACAADEIIADESSIVGSIGVISAGFGYQGLLEKLGVERRVHTAGTEKDALDPFRPERPEDVERLKAVQQEVHESFKALVRERRGGRLRGDEAELFNGAFWVSGGALKLGLIDGVGEIRTELKKRFGNKVRIVPVSPDRPFWRPAGSPGVRGGGFSLARAPEALMAALDARALWARFGL